MKATCLHLYPANIQQMVFFSIKMGLYFHTAGNDPAVHEIPLPEGQNFL
jgi:hypothetical protein